MIERRSSREAAIHSGQILDQVALLNENAWEPHRGRSEGARGALVVPTLNNGRLNRLCEQFLENQ